MAALRRLLRQILCGGHSWQFDGRVAGGDVGQVLVRQHCIRCQAKRVAHV